MMIINVCIHRVNCVVRNFHSLQFLPVKYVILSILQNLRFYNKTYSVHVLERCTNNQKALISAVFVGYWLFLLG